MQEPHVVPIHDFGEIDEQLFVDMRLIEASDLGSILSRFGPLAPPRAVAIICQVSATSFSPISCAVPGRKLSTFLNTAWTTIDLCGYRNDAK